MMMNTTATTWSISRTATEEPVVSLSVITTARFVVTCSSATPNAALREATRMLGTCSRKLKPFMLATPYPACTR